MIPKWLITSCKSFICLIRNRTTRRYNVGTWIKVEAARALRNGVETGVLRVTHNGVRDDLVKMFYNCNFSTIVMLGRIYQITNSFYTFCKAAKVTFI